MLRLNRTRRRLNEEDDGGERAKAELPLIKDVEAVTRNSASRPYTAGQRTSYLRTIRIRTTRRASIARCAHTKLQSSPRNRAKGSQCTSASPSSTASRRRCACGIPFVLRLAVTKDTVACACLFRHLGCGCTISRGSQPHCLFILPICYVD